MILVSLLLALFASADVEKSQTEILTLTGLSEKTVLAETQKSLEAYLFYDEDGISCGLEEFSVSYYTAPAQSPVVSFTIATETTGPVNYCGGYATYMCYTEWKLKNNQWTAIASDCEDGSHWEE